LTTERFLLSGIDVLGLTALQGLVRGFGAFVPRLVVALAILAAGLVVANFAWRATLLTANNARMSSPRLLSNAVRLLILILAVAMALEQIAVAQTVVLTAFAIAFGAVMTGLAIAFGIGGAGLARRFLEQQFPEQPPADPDRVFPFMNQPDDTRQASSPAARTRSSATSKSNAVNSASRP
jgi:hypothetical protein